VGDVHLLNVAADLSSSQHANLSSHITSKLTIWCCFVVVVVVVVVVIAQQSSENVSYPG